MLTHDESADRKIVVTEGNWASEEDDQWMAREDVAKIMLEIAESQ
jgi:hypothetical protein